MTFAFRYLPRLQGLISMNFDDDVAQLWCLERSESRQLCTVTAGRSPS